MSCSSCRHSSIHAFFSSDGSNYVRSSMFEHSKPKMGYSGPISIRWTHLSLFDVRKNDVWVSLMNNLVNLITNIWTRASSFDVRKMMFDFVQCSIIWCSTHHYSLVVYMESFKLNHRYWTTAPSVSYDQPIICSLNTLQIVVSNWVPFKLLWLVNPVSYR